MTLYVFMKISKENMIAINATLCFKEDGKTKSDVSYTVF